MSDVVLSLFSRHVDGLKRSGDDNYLGYCPIHGEVAGKSKSRSLHVNVATGQWICFAQCGGGGLRSFLRKVMPADKAEAAFERAARFLKEPKKKTTRLSSEIGEFRCANPLPERILGLFDYIPQDLIDAGFDDAVLQDHDIGLDLVRDRITYPVRDVDGYLAAIVGRNPDGQHGPKYTRYTWELEEMGHRGHDYPHRDLLWRCDRVYPAAFVGGARPVIPIVEGFKACLWMVQRGFPLTMALMGARMTPSQARLVERLGGTVVLFLDNNDAGLKGTDRIGHTLRGTRVRVVQYPNRDPSLQPDSLCPADLHEVVETALPFGRWRDENRDRLPRVQNQPMNRKEGSHGR